MACGFSSGFDSGFCAGSTPTGGNRMGGTGAIRKPPRYRMLTLLIGRMLLYG